MYNVNKVQKSLAGVIGFFNAYDPSIRQLPPELTSSSSGIYIQNVHALLTIDNIYNSAPEFDNYVYPMWVDGAYLAGAIVRHSGDTFRAKENIILGDDAPADADDNKWGKVDLFAEWLLSFVNDASREVISDLIRYKNVAQSTKTILSSLKLFDGIGSINDRIIKKGRFVGLELTLPSSDGISVLIDKIGMQLDAAQDLDFYLYHTTSNDPITVFTVHFDKAGNFNWKEPGGPYLPITFFADEYETGGKFYLGYYEDDLTGQAIRRSGDLSRPPCLGCSNWNYDAFIKWSEHLTIRAIYVPEDYIYGDRKLFDLSKIAVEAESNWGLNLSLSVVCDPSAFFVKNLPIIQDALSMKIALKLLQVIAFNTRMNKISDQTRALAMAEIELSQKGSFLNKYLAEISAISLDFEGLSRHCFPYANKSVITKRTIA